jgi:hypothetical protein
MSTSSAPGGQAKELQIYGEEQVLKLTVRIGNLEAINKTLRQEI